MHSNKLGLEGETKAVKYLKKLRYKIIERNYTIKTGEIDIIASQKNILCFIEVKTRVSDSFAPPHLSVGYAKQRKYVSIAKQYAVSNQIRDVVIRFDIIEIVGDKINHIKNAFTA